MGNGAKAQQKRERNARGSPKGGQSQSQSQKKANKDATTIVCETCKQSFFITTRAPALEEHAANRHSKTIQDCFPKYIDPKNKSSKV